LSAHEFAARSNSCCEGVCPRVGGGGRAPACGDAEPGQDNRHGAKRELKSSHVLQIGDRMSWHRPACVTVL